MAVFEIQGADGKTYEVEAPDIKTAVSVLKSVSDGPGGVSTDSEAVADFSNKGRSLFEGAKSGATFGYAPEGVGLLSGALGFEPNDTGGATPFDYSGNFSDRYTAARDKVRNQFNTAQEDNPGIFTAGQVAGAIPAAVVSGGMATGGSLATTSARGGVIGAIEGALHGSGNSPDDRLGGGLKGGGIGGSAGVLAPPLVAGTSIMANAVKDPVTGILDSLLGRANVGKANRAVGKTLRDSGKTADEVAQIVSAAQRDGMSEYRMVDALGMAGQRRASGITRSGGDAATELADFLEKRQYGQSERVGGLVNDAFGLDGGSANKTKSTLKSARTDKANAAYDAARGNAVPVDTREAISVIDARIGGMQGVDITGDSIDAKLSKFRKRLIANKTPDGVESIELSDFDRVLGVKQDVEDAIGAAVRGGRNNEARELRKLKNSLDASLEESSDMYRAANDGFAADSRVIDAVDTGAAMSRINQRAVNTTEQFKTLNPDQQASARVGYGDDLLGKIEANTAPTANKAKILQSPKRDSEANIMALDPAAYQTGLSRENDMWQTQNRALQGSRTADNIQDINAVSETTSGVTGAAQSAANLKLGDAVAKIAAMLAPLAKGQNNQTRTLIARALMSRNPKEALAPILRQEIKSQSGKRVVEAILRNSGRTALQ